MNKNIKTKINTNTNDKATCAQAHSVYKSKNIKFKYLKKNNKIVTNNTKCHFDTNVILMIKI
jgi:hypothetical protein